MKGVERTNTVIINPNKQIGLMPRCNLYVIEVNCKRNYYSCRDFGHITRNCKNWEIMRRERKLEYRDN